MSTSTTNPIVSLRAALAGTRAAGLIKPEDAMGTQFSRFPAWTPAPPAAATPTS
jgi:hypothetical protein